MDTLLPASIDLVRFVRAHRPLFVLTGAGVSTESGIPAYRDATGIWKRTAPVMFQDFVRDDTARKRYWSRSMAGWPRIAAALPNAGHRALARLQASGIVGTLVTQNVDGLHQKAGSADVVELHGNLGDVVCLGCGLVHSRADLQRRLEDDNAALVGMNPVAAPDGDADLGAASIDAFVVPACPRCAGILKPDVVFFGENVPRSRVEEAMAALDAASALLVVGSSLAVYSGYRFCEQAARGGKPIASLNLGATRADALLAFKVEAPCGEALVALVDALAL